MGFVVSKSAGMNLAWVIRPVLWGLLWLSFGFNTMAAELSLAQKRTLFLKAETAVLKNQESIYQTSVQSLKDYPLLTYLQYQWLKNHLQETQAIQQFLKQQAETRYAVLLREKWLLHLAQKQQWRLFLDYYEASNDTKLQCLLHTANYRTGETRIALEEAKILWAVGHSQPKECNFLFQKLVQSKSLTREVVWQRYKAALQNRNLKLARYVIRFMNKTDRKSAEYGLTLATKPDLILGKDFKEKKLTEKGFFFAYGVGRLIGSSLERAIQVWDAGKARYQIDPDMEDELENRFALNLAVNRDEQAYERLSRLKKPTVASQEWRVRSALRIQDWLAVDQSIAAMDKHQQKKEQWRYWQARALEQINRPKPARFIYKHLAGDRSFYGYLAADRLNTDYSLAHKSVGVTEGQMEAFKRQPAIELFNELLAVNKKTEARRQWWFTIKRLDHDQKLVAAKFVSELGWTREAIFTLAKAQYWDDVDLRFPVLYEKQVLKNANLRELSPAIILGLIRQESAFNEQARSGVGAAGLMQIMPKTGQKIAQELKEKWRSHQGLYNPETNVRYGAYYYKKLLNQFDQHYALAAAAYNAGPGRVKRWLPQESPLAADIWVETIPFKETRHYVATVLTYALIYQKKLKKQFFTIKELMKDIVPG